MTPAALANAVKRRFAAWLGFGLGVFHLANVAGVFVVSTMVVRAVHLTAVLVLIYFLVQVGVASGSAIAGMFDWNMISFFLGTGDDGRHVFAVTLAEHEQNLLIYGYQ